MPLSPSMKVMALLQLAVFRNAGSYPIRPKSSSETLICRRPLVRIQPFSIGTSYVFPVRLSVMVSVSLGMGGLFTGGGALSTKKNHARRGRVSLRAHSWSGKADSGALQLAPEAGKALFHALGAGEREWHAREHREGRRHHGLAVISPAVHGEVRGARGGRVEGERLALQGRLSAESVHHCADALQPITLLEAQDAHIVEGGGARQHTGERRQGGQQIRTLGARGHQAAPGLARQI